MESLIVLMSLLSAPVFGQQGGPVIQQPKKVFLVEGFDDNDNVQVVLSGFFPNTCYRSGPTKYKVDKTNKIIDITHTAEKTGSQFCATVLVPYFQVVDVGTLPKGAYKVRAKSPHLRFVQMGQLQVKSAPTPSKDDHLYAPVEAIETELEFPNELARFFLVGAFTNTCMVIDRVKIQRKKDIVVVLPIMKLEQKGCKDAQIPFRHEVVMQSALWDDSLIHARALSGRGVNQVVRVWKDNHRMSD